MYMNTPSRRIGVFEPPFEQMSMWEDAAVKGGDSSPNTGGSTIVQVEAVLDHRDSIGPLRDQEANKPDEKVKRRLAQNREAARKSRLRKKAYVQQLESSRSKLAQIEQDLKRARDQGLHITSALDTSPTGLSGTLNPEIVAFEMEYSHWMDEQHRHNCQLRTALQSHITPTELRSLVETVLSHYYGLFQMKAVAARADVFYIMSGMGKTSAERFFLWIGGFRPSELLNVLMSHFDPLTDKQIVAVGNLRQSSQQAEDALSQGMDKLQQTLSQGIASDPIVLGSYGSQMGDAMEKLEMMESFANQADHLRQQTLQQMSRILTTRQAARGLLGLGEYCHRLRALSSLWAARPREPV